MLSTNYCNASYQPQFKAQLTMPNKAIFEKFTGKYCADQIEIARPTIEKIAKEATGTEHILVEPYAMERRHPLYDEPEEIISIGAIDKNGGRAYYPQIEPSDAKCGESFAQCIINTVKEVIQGARDRDWLC